MLKKFIKSLGVSGFGLVTSLATAVAVTVVEKLTTINIFTVSILVFVPVGALLTGFVAASGYYIGSIYFHQRPSWIILIQMLVIASLTNILIYYFEYRTLILDSGVAASQVLDFPRYLNIYLSSQEIRVGRGGQSGGELGEAGYWLAGLDFIGFLVGGIGIYCYLLDRKFCRSCDRYYKTNVVRKRFFGSSQSASYYYDGLFSNYVDSEEFSHQARIGSAEVVDSPIKLMITTTLLSCPTCKKQMWRDEVSAWNGQEWKSRDALERVIPIPEGVDLTDIVQGPETFSVFADPTDTTRAPTSYCEKADNG